MSEVLSARRTQTRERLIEAAIGVFAEKGVLGASVEEISEAAGFTRGAFYSNFDSKDALCLALLEHQGSAHLAATREAIDSLTHLAASQTPSLDDIVDQAIEVFLRAQRDDRASMLASIELRLYAVRVESLRAGYLAFFDRVSSEFIGLLTEAAGSFGYRLRVPGGELLAVLQGVWEQSAIAALLERRSPDAPQRAQLLGGVLKSMLVQV